MPLTDPVKNMERNAKTTQDSGLTDPNDNLQLSALSVDSATSRHPGNGVGHKPILIEDWDCLFGAVQDRIAKAIALLHADGRCCDPSEVDSGHVTATLLDCSADLTRLHAALRIERLMRATV